MSQSPDHMPAFGVGKVLSDTFQVYKIAFMPLFLVMAGVVVITSLFTVGIGGGGALVGSATLSINTQITLGLINVALLVVAFGACVLIAYEAGHGRPVSISGCLAQATQLLFPMIVLSIVFYVVLVFLMIFLLIPGLWIMGVWAVTIPAIMIERAGFGAFGRSARLTKEYRWPIIGTMILGQILVGIVIMLAVSIVYAIAGTSFSEVMSGAAALMEAPSLGAIVIIIVVQAVLNGISYGLFSALIVAIYMRLSEIKEGGDQGITPEVFS